MILDEWVEKVWNQSNKGRYEALGYTFTNYGDVFQCRISHLTDADDRVRFRVQCDSCKTVYTRTNVVYTNALKKYGRYLCTGCITAARNKAQAHTVEEVRRYFEDVGLLPLFTSYTENKEKLPYACPNHPGRIYYKSLSHVKVKLKTGTSGCPSCVREEKSLKQSLPFELVLQNSAKFDVTVLTPPEDYTNSSTKISFMCNKHPEFGIQTMRAGQLTKVKNMCYKCSKENFSGASHPNFQPNATLDKHLRLIIEPWRKEQFILAKGLCELSGVDRNLQVHHLVPLHVLRDQVVREAGLTVNPKTRLDVTAEQLELISRLFIEKHKTKKIGVVVSKSLHKLFHSLYGNKDCDGDDFADFSTRYKKGEISDKTKNSSREQDLPSV